MSERTHDYAARLVWDGNTGEGTARYDGYGRDYRVLIADKPELPGSADPLFRGDPSRHNPEDHFLAAISACHMLSYLALCARHGVRVLGYEDEASGRLALRADGGGAFDEVVLRPAVTIDNASKQELALQLHDTAHERCFIANSCRVPIRHEPVIRPA